jgi:type III secretion protein L
MVFLIPKHPLTPVTALSARIDPGVKVIRAADLAARRDAHGLLEAARIQAADIVKDARRIYEEEALRGYREGREQASRELSTQLADVAVRSASYYAAAGPQIADLVMAAIHQVIGELGDKKRITAVVRQCLAAVRGQKLLTLRVNDTQAALVREQVNSLMKEFPGIDTLDVIEDASISYDACKLESGIGIVEGSIEGELEAIQQAFRQALGERS